MRVNYIRNCVEEVVGRLDDKTYSQAIELSQRSNCQSMQDRINAIVRWAKR